MLINKLQTLTNFETFRLFKRSFNIWMSKNKTLSNLHTYLIELEKKLTYFYLLTYSRKRFYSVIFRIIFNIPGSQSPGKVSRPKGNMSQNHT